MRLTALIPLLACGGVLVACGGGAPDDADTTCAPTMPSLTWAPVRPSSGQVAYIESTLAAATSAVRGPFPVSWPLPRGQKAKGRAMLLTQRLPAPQATGQRSSRPSSAYGEHGPRTTAQ